MYIQERNGKYRAYQTYSDALTGRQRTVSVTIDKLTAQSRNKAQRRLDALIEQRQSATPGTVTVRQIADLYIRYQTRTVKESTLIRNKFAAKAICSILGDAKADKLTAGVVRDRLLSYSDKPTTINELLKRYKAMMRWAYRSDLVADVSYLDKLAAIPDRTKREKLADKFLEREECDRLVEGMESGKWSNLTKLLIMSGLRIGEALALDESDVDLDRRMLVIDKTVVPQTGKMQSTKTEASCREVYMQDELYAFLRSLLAENKRNRKILYLDHSPLFFDLDGSRLRYRAYSAYLADRSAEILGRKITPHTLRHTHASLLAEAGVDYESISRRLGHAGSKITKEIYIHVTEKRKEQENERMKRISFFA